MSTSFRVRAGSRVLKLAHNKVRFLATVLLGVLGAVVAVGGIGLALTAHELRALHHTNVVASAAIADFEQSLFEADHALHTAFETTSAQQVIGASEAADRSLVRARAAWDRYRSVAPSDDETFRHKAGVDTMLSAWTESTNLLKARVATADRNSESTRAIQELADRRFNVLRQQLHPLHDSTSAAVNASAQRSSDRLASTLWIGAVVVAIGSIIAFIVVRFTVRATIAQQREIDRRDATQRSEANRTEQESRVQRALEMAKTEPEALHSLQLALRWLVPDTSVELLLADSSRAHVRQAVTTDEQGRGPGCTVATPHDCPAVTRGQTLTYDDSTAFDACPHLRDRGIEACSAVCVPVSIMGAPAGVLHSIGAPRVRATAEQLQALELAAGRIGERVGLLRAFAQSETKAATDPLTGLANRRTVESRVVEMVRDGADLAVAYCDLDHFKNLNDTHGHDTGDRALRIFARTLRDNVRPEDIVGRWGGEEFVVVLPRTRARSAVAVMERVREALALNCADASVPTFTVSVGVADDDMGADFNEIVQVADTALLQAKANGRNRVVVATTALVAGARAASVRVRESIQSERTAP